MRASLFALALLCSACGQPDEPDEDALQEEVDTPGVQDPVIPSLPTCTRLTDEEAKQAQRTLPPAGNAAGWAINGDSRLVCSEPGPESVTGCELAPGGIALVARAGETIGYRNGTSSPLSITIAADAATCGPLAIPPGPLGR